MKRNFAHLDEEQQKARHRVIDAAWHRRSRGTIDESSYRALTAGVDAKFKTPTQTTADDIVRIDARFGKLTVVGFTKNEFGQTEAVCRCACGTKEHRTNISKLASRHTKSCGCLRYCKRSALDVIAGSILTTYKSCAKQKGLLFELDRYELLHKPCFYCGAAPYRVWSIRYRKEIKSFPCNGIDRVDNTLGYLRSNVVSCCPRCNYAKRNMSVQEFAGWAIQLATHLREHVVSVVSNDLAEANVNT